MVDVQVSPIVSIGFLGQEKAETVEATMARAAMVRSWIFMVSLKVRVVSLV